MFSHRKKIQAFITYVIPLFIVVFLCADVYAQSAQKIKLVGTLPIGHPLTDALYVFKKYIETKSNNQMVVEVYPAQQLYNDKDLVSIMPKGGVDVCFANTDMWTGLIPTIGFFYTPLLFDNEDHFFRVAHSDAGNVVASSMERGRVKFLGWIHYGTGDMLFKTPVKSLEDIKGKRVRSYGQTTSYFMQAMGAAPVMMSSGEMYDALQKGAIDGVISGVTSMRSRKLYEVAKYVPDAEIQPVVPFMTIANLKFWNSLSKDRQQILQEAALEVEKYSRIAGKKDIIESRKILAKNGVVFNKISPKEFQRWQKTAVPMMMKKLKENIDPALVDRMNVSLEKERTAVEKTAMPRKKGK